MRTVNKYGTRSLDGVSSEFFLMSQVTVLSHSFTSDPGVPGTVHTDIEVVGASTFTILFQGNKFSIILSHSSTEETFLVQILHQIETELVLHHSNLQLIRYSKLIVAFAIIRPVPELL